MKLIVVRHGETKENAGRIIQGQRHGTLSEKGEAQVLALAESFKNVRFDAVYSSDLRRCVKTAEAIVGKHQGVKLQTDKRLREFSFGILEGLPLASKKHRFSRFGLKLPLRLFGIETPKRVEARLRSFVNEKLEQTPGHTIIVVTHGGPIRLLYAMTSKTSFSRLLFKEIDNCSVHEFDIKNKI